MPTWEQLNQQRSVSYSSLAYSSNQAAETLVTDTRAQLSPMQVVDQKLQSIFRRKSLELARQEATRLPRV